MANRYLQVYSCRVKGKKQIQREFPRELQGWWADVAAAQLLTMRQAVQSDIDRCSLDEPRSRNPKDYMCEICDHGALVPKDALEYMTAQENLFAKVWRP